jgi:hypothetical protein
MGWTKKPLEEGYHWAICGEALGMGMVFVHADMDACFDEDETRDENAWIIEHNGNPKSMTLAVYIEWFHAEAFYKIPIPKKPLKRENK